MARKKTIEKFIKKAKIKHGDKYDYSSFFKLIKQNKELNQKPPKFRGYFFTLSFTQDFIIKENILKISYSNYRKLEIKLDYINQLKI